MSNNANVEWNDDEFFASSGKAEAKPALAKTEVKDSWDDDEFFAGGNNEKWDDEAFLSERGKPAAGDQPEKSNKAVSSLGFEYDLPPVDNRGLESSSTEAMDYVKAPLAGATSGMGFMMRGTGEMFREGGQAVASGLNKLFGTDVFTAENPLTGGAEWWDETAEKIRNDMSPAAIRAMNESTPEGNLLTLENLSFGQKPTVAGYSLNALNVFGQLAPVVGTAALTRGAGLKTQMASSAGVSGVLGGGGAAKEEGDRIRQMTPEMLQNVPLYQEMRSQGMSHEQALEDLTKTVETGAFRATAPVSAITGLMLGGILSKPGQAALSKVVGTSMLARGATGAALVGTEEAVQEVAEGVATKAGVNYVTGEDRDLGDESFANFVLGFMGGAGAGAAGGAIGVDKADGVGDKKDESPLDADELFGESAVDEIDLTGGASADVEAPALPAPVIEVDSEGVAGTTAQREQAARDEQERLDSLGITPGDQKAIDRAAAIEAQSPAASRRATQQRLPENFTDVRLGRDTYRDAIQHMVKNDFIEGGGVALIPDPDFVRGDSDSGNVPLKRTPSLNPDWVQSILEDEQVSVADVQKAIDRALSGGKLGVRQSRVVTRLLDQVTGERTAPENIESVMQARKEAQDLRKIARGEFVPDEAYENAMAEYAGELYEESEYDPFWDGQTRSFYELYNEAEEVDPETTYTLFENMYENDTSLPAIAKALVAQVINRDTQGVPNENEAGTGNAGFGAGAYQGEQGQRPYPAAAPTAQPAALGRFDRPAEPAGQPAGQPATATAQAGLAPVSDIPPAPVSQTAPVSDTSQAAIDAAASRVLTQPDSPAAGDRRHDSGRAAAGDRRANTRARDHYDTLSKDELVDQLMSHELTGVKGRRAFVIEQEDAKHFVSVDADSLKWVNDNMSPDNGDRLLQAVANALVNEFGYDNVYHISGDEFFVLGFDETDSVLLKEGMRRVEEKLKDVAIEAEKPDGTQITLNGLAATPGYGTSKQEADNDLKQEKQQREKRGERAPRGESPTGATVRAAEGEPDSRGGPAGMDEGGRSPGGETQTGQTAKRHPGLKSNKEAAPKGAVSTSGDRKNAPDPQEEYQALIDELPDGQIDALYKAAKLPGPRKTPTDEKRQVLRGKPESDIHPIYVDLVDSGKMPADPNEEIDTTTEEDWDIPVENFPEPDKTVNADKNSGAFIPQDKAAQILNQWKAEAKRIGKEEDHSNEVIISVFDASGEISKPWREAGYTVLQYDIKLGDDLLEFMPTGDLIDIAESGKRVVGVIAQPPCTCFTSTGSQWWAKRHDVNDRAMVNKMFGPKAAEYFSKPAEYTKALVSMTDKLIELADPDFFMLENPNGGGGKTRIQPLTGLPEPTLIFQPNNYGDPYTKKTLLWGNFNPDLPAANVEPTKGSLMHKMWSSAEKNGGKRSETPEGFAYAFFMANNTSTGVKATNSVEIGTKSVVPKMGIDEAANEAATSPDNDLPAPTEAQKEAGNYKKGSVRIQGMDISIENPAGSKRNPEWPALKHHYGYFKGSKGADGDHVDVFIGNDTDSGKVFVIDQINQDKSFDEHKVMLGFKTKMGATKAYNSNYEKGWTGKGAITEMTVDQFKEWLAGDTTKPVAYKQKQHPGLKKKPAAAKSKPDQEAKASDNAGDKDSAAKNPSTSQGNIDDVGEKLEGARKFMSFKRDASDEDIASLPLSKIWPKNAFDDIKSPLAKSFAVAARAEIPAKPRKAYKVKRWVETVQMYRSLMTEIAEGIETGSDITKELIKRMGQKSSLKPFVAKVELMTEIDPAHWDRIGVVKEYPDSMRIKDSKEVPSPVVYVSIDGRNKTFSAKSWRDALPEIKQALGQEAAERKMAFEVRGRASKGYYINKKGDKEYRRLAEFDNTKDAFKYMDENYDDLVAAWEKVKARDNVRKADMRNKTNRPRVGADHRNGRDVTAEEFAEEFGFRGVQFGNWVSQGAGSKDRQGMINLAYDALMDLAGIVGIPPKAISLNGELGLAFGARGKGSAMAHFEPDMMVINLTKTKGAGSFAHEWFHALDNYFQRQRGERTTAGREGSYITYAPEPLYRHKTARIKPITRKELERYYKLSNQSDLYNPDNWEKDPNHPKGVRPEVESAFARLVDALNDSPMRQRALTIDQGKPDGYWSRIIERAARSFENYVIAKMVDSGYHNDYLANVTDIEHFQRNPDRYPYLLDNEIEPVKQAFDTLFETIETKETETGVALFSKSSGSSSPAYLDAEVIYEAVRDNFLEVLPEDAAIDDVMDAINEFPGDMQRLIRALDQDNWLGFDYPAQAIESALTDDISLWEPSIALKQAIGRMVNAGPMLSRNKAWGNFPDTIIPLRSVDNHPDYKAAKAGDSEAALRLAIDSVTDEYINEVRAAIGDSSPVIVPVMAVERAGKNKIPLAVAKVLADRLGLEVSDSVVQTDKVSRTGADGFHRLANQPSFDGSIEPGRDYIILDDTQAQGGTLAQLKAHIESQGGNVVLATALTGKLYSAKLALRDKTLQQLRQDYGSIENWWKDEFGYGFEGLTESEARYILKSGSSPESVRNKITEARYEGGKPVYGRSSQETPRGRITPTRKAAISGLSASEVKKTTGRISKKWKNAPQIKVVQSQDQLPASIAQHLNDSDIVHGVFHNGRVYLVADNLSDQAHVESTLLHETLLHYGIRETFSSAEINKILNLIWDTNPSVRKEAAKRMTQEGLSKAVAVEEVLADMVGRGEATKLNGWKRLIQAIKSWLAKHGFIKLTGQDIVDQVISAARKAVVDGKTRFTGSSSPAFSKQAPTFYSQMQAVLEEKLPGKGEASQLKKQINNLSAKGEFKAEELEWSGINEWLDSQIGKKLSKQDVIDFVHANQIQVQEVEKGVSVNDPRKGTSTVIETGLTQREAEIELSRDDEAGMYMVDNGDGTYDIVQDYDGSDGPGDETKYSEWQLPGGENYRELLLKLPFAGDAGTGLVANEIDEGKWVAWNVETQDAEFEGTQQEVADYVRRANSSSKDGRPVYKSGHFNEPNIIAHVRFNERTDADGKRVLFIEEIQSDWHQAGRKKGYDNGQIAEQLKSAQKELSEAEQAYDERTRQIPAKEFADMPLSAVQALPEARRVAEAKDAVFKLQRTDAVPDAPFKTTWPLLAMKRMIRHAAENGFDKIAWTTGEQQNARYDLSHQVKSLSIYHDGNGRYDISARKLDDGGLVDIAEGISEQSLEEHIGKELAKRVVSEQTGKGRIKFEGVDLKVGGLGMKGFYDQILPKAVNKYVKKWGAKVGETTITATQEADIMNGEFEDQTGEFIAHSIDVTPSMKSAAMSGQPMFSKNKSQKQLNKDLDSGQPIDKVFRKAFEVARVPKVTKEIYRRGEQYLTQAKFDEDSPLRFMNPVLESARAGLIDRYGLDESYKQRDFKREADKRKLELQAVDYLETLAKGGVTDAREAAVLQAVLTGEAVPEGDWAELAQPIREAIDELGREAMELGLISRDSYERNKGSYLHRVYKGHEANQSKLGKWVSSMAGSRRKRIRGNELKGRGMTMKATQDSLLQLTPKDWWGRKEQLGKADKQLKGAKFHVFDRLAHTGEGTMNLPGMEQKQKGKLKERVFWPADRPVPAKYQAWENRGEWEVRDTQGNKVVLWRDFTKGERTNMGEILDARYTIAKTFMLMAHDLSTGRFLKDIASNENWAKSERPAVPDEFIEDNPERRRGVSTYSDIDWVKVPDTSIGGAKVKKWGALAGKYVRAEIWRDLNELDRLQMPGFWKSVLTQWKLNKTARNPVVHMNNVMSNLVFMDMADVRWVDLMRAIYAYRHKTEEYQDALEKGAFGASYIEHEIRREVLDPIIEEMMAEDKAMKKGAVEAYMDDREMLAKISVLGKILDKGWQGALLADKKMTDVYQFEDEIFRLATFLRRQSLGDDADTAAQTARDQFLNYDIRAPWVNAARNSFLPFISYTYRAIPVISKSIAERPWKLAKYATVAYAVNALGYALAPSGDDEDKERRSMRDAEQGHTWLGTPRMIRMPWLDDHGNPVFMDIRRWIPAGDVFDMNQSQGAVPVPAWLQFGGPLMIAAEVALNKQAFTGQEIINHKTDDWADIIEKDAMYLWRSWMPSAPWIPGGWYWDKIGRSITGGRDVLGNDYSLPEAFMSSTGIKIRSHDVDLNFSYKAREFSSVLRELQYQAQDLERDKRRNLIDEGRYQKEKKDLMRKMEVLTREAKETFGKG